MRNVRNFWIDGNVDGSATVLRGGPRSRDGGFQLRVHMRNEGEPKLALTLRGFVTEGALILDLEPGDLELRDIGSAGEGYRVLRDGVRVVTER